MDTDKHVRTLTDTGLMSFHKKRTIRKNNRLINYSMCVHLYKYWILRLIDIDVILRIVQKYSASKEYNKLNQIGIDVKNCGDNNERKLKRFKL